MDCRSALLLCYVFLLRLTEFLFCESYFKIKREQRLHVSIFLNVLVRCAHARYFNVIIGDIRLYIVTYQSGTIGYNRIIAHLSLTRYKRSCMRLGMVAEIL